MEDVVVVGGGVVGLSLAWELAQRGARVRIVERGDFGQEASWAGAGILPPLPENWPTDPQAAQALVALHRRSLERHTIWHERLLDATGIDNEYWHCGGVVLAAEALGISTEAADESLAPWREGNVPVHRLSPTQWQRKWPGLSAAVDAVWSLPTEAQIRNPRHLKALIAVCEQSGVAMVRETEVHAVCREGNRVVALETSAGRTAVNEVIFCGGAWMGALSRTLGHELPIVPVRGQIALLRPDEPLIDHVVNIGHRYLVPRRDGCVLVGSTEEVCPTFEKRCTPSGIAGLLELATAVVPKLASASLERTWSGLRPRTPDLLPYLGRWQDLDNVAIATGHFRAGLTLSTGTAELMADCLLGSPAKLDLSSFRVDRPLAEVQPVVSGPSDCPA
jgi:glycine oxidase